MRGSLFLISLVLLGCSNPSESKDENESNESYLYLDDLIDSDIPDPLNDTSSYVSAGDIMFQMDSLPVEFEELIISEINSHDSEMFPWLLEDQIDSLDCIRGIKRNATLDPSEKHIEQSYYFMLTVYRDNKKFGDLVWLDFKNKTFGKWVYPDSTHFKYVWVLREELPLRTDYAEFKKFVEN